MKTYTKLIIAWLAISLAGTGFAEIVADLLDDYQSGGPAPGWRYLWNQPENWNTPQYSEQDWSSNPLGRADGYAALLPQGGAYTPAGAPANTNPEPGKWLCVRGGGARGDQPGYGAEQPSTSVDRYVIYAYTIQADDGDGNYKISASSLSSANPKIGRGDTCELRIFVNDTEIGKPAVFAGAFTGESFDCDLGALQKGDTVYVAVGPHGSSARDAWQIDFSIECSR